MKVFIEEEYGYRYWVWDFPGTASELVSEWCAGHVPPVGYVYGPQYRGSITPAEDADFDPATPGFGFAAYCHIHEPEDSELCVEGTTTGWKAPVDHTYVWQDLMRQLAEQTNG